MTRLPLQPTLSKALSVSEFIKIVRMHLQTAVGTVTVQGEVSGYKVNRETLVFFELKDKESRIVCFMMRFEQTVPITDGMEVKVTGYPSMFQKAGSFHFRVQSIEPVGAGALQQAFELLKKKLTAEGLFATERKRLLPRFPARIGLVTSPDAAAYTDVLQILNNRWGGLTIHLTPVGVQSQDAVSQIVGAIAYQNRVVKPDVIILTRGGGSLEDLQAFNSEAVARAIYASRIPIVCGVGHERDVTIADYVADVRASTPSNAAERVVPNRKQVLFEIATLTEQAGHSLERRMRDQNSAVTDLIVRLEDVFRLQRQRYQELTGSLLRHFSIMLERIHSSQTTLKHRHDQLTNRIEILLRQSRDRIKHQTELLSSLNPERILKRGYSVTLNAAGQIITSAEAVPADEIITTKLAQGQLKSKTIKP
ncbi:MAG: exodeoxyribonuclease VII large subunit [Patescibacteria group bacterium]|jgi:exodeoxyribonuclease VII large subunit